MNKIFRKKRFIIPAGFLAVYLVLLVLSFFIIPKGGPLSYAMYDKNGILIGAQVAADEQWRFEPSTVPDKFSKCIVQFEDRRFYFHPGVDLISIFRALKSNLSSKRIVSGGSTITMQTIRILENNPERTILQKIKEAFLAIVLEVRYSKKKILELYAANAPFGGNVVGLEAASWRYFYRPPEDLTWAESATLAVLPNQPSLVYPGANSQILLRKRNNLLKRLYEKEYMDHDTYELSLMEPLPGKPYDLPRLSSHYLEYLKSRSKKGAKFYTNIDSSIQKNTQRVLETWSNQLSRKGINNAAAIILDTETKQVLAYCGNTSIFDRNIKNGSVDLIQSKRSSGSLLKPFLYAAMLDSGQLLPEQLVVDVPTRIGSYRPDNNVPKYEGVVPANDALSKSLNIPAIRELRDYGINAFLDVLQKSGFTTFNRTSDEYGLPLILGGGEITLYEAVSAYADMMNSAASRYCGTFPCTTGSSYLTLTALSEGNRPAEESNWQIYANSKRIAWKTGTSSGNRDAWAVGTTNEYTVGVWIGNAEGEGNPEIKSITTSAPVLFDIFSTLPVTSWIQTPYTALKNVEVCGRSGFLAGPYCDEIKSGFTPVNAGANRVCPYCKTVSFTPDLKYQATVEDLMKKSAGEYYGKFPVTKNCFVLPADLEYWYSKIDMSYTPLPEYVDWHISENTDDFSIIFPEDGSNIIIPIEIDGTEGAMVIQAAAHSDNATLYWDLDGEFIGFTSSIHELKISPDPGDHLLTITDSNGTVKKKKFKIVCDLD